jgi:hypothetical protein
MKNEKKISTRQGHRSQNTASDTIPPYLRDTQKAMNPVPLNPITYCVEVQVPLVPVIGGVEKGNRSIIMFDDNTRCLTLHYV